MPVLKAGQQTPTVSVQVPVPAPVQQQPKRSPVSFGGEQPPPAQPAGPSGVPPVAPPRPKLSAVILPWSPPPVSQPKRSMQRRLPNRVIKYAAPINAVNAGETAHQALTRFLGNRNQRAHGRTARVFRLDNGDIAVRLHNTNVVVAHQNGQVTMNHGGYMTSTSRRFISGYSGIPVSFAGGTFSVRNPHTGAWEEYENNTPYPPVQPQQSNEPVPERGRLTPEQVTLLHQHLTTRELTPLGMLGDSLTESGYPHTGELLSRHATGDPGTGSSHIGEYHAPYQQSPHLNEYDFHFTPGSGKHGLHELHIQTPDDVLPMHEGPELRVSRQFRVVGSKPAPEQLSRLPRRVVRYSGTTTEEDFHKMLDANPDDHQTRLIFADWLQERGDPRADGYRAMGSLRVRPYRSIHSNDESTPWLWGSSRNPMPVSNHEPYPRIALPSRWLRTIEGSHQYYGNNPRPANEDYWRYHRTRREAEDAAAVAFSKLSPKLQASITARASKLSRKVVRYSATPTNS